MELGKKDSRYKRYNKERSYIIADLENYHSAKVEKENNRRRYWDRKCESFAKIVNTEIKKRNIDLNDNEAANKIEEIVTECLQSKIFSSRFDDMDFSEILNAVKRYINSNNIEKEGPSREE